MNKPVCVVIGVGVGNGAAIARKFSENGHKVALLARTLEFTSQLACELNDAIAVACDVTNEHDVLSAFSQIRAQLGEITSLIYNAGAGSWGTVEEISAAAFESNWRVNALGALLATQQVIPAMKESGSGNIVFVGATASRRGNAKLPPFLQPKLLNVLWLSQWLVTFGLLVFMSHYLLLMALSTFLLLESKCPIKTMIFL